MLKNYLKVACRNLLHNKLYAIVNILGMGAALAVGITAYLTHTYNYTFDAFHRNAGKIYRVKTVRWFNGQEQNWGIVPRPLAPALAANFPAVEHAVRLSRHAAAFRHGDNVFNETILHVDAEFFEMFDFPLKFGSAETLRDKNKLVLSAKLAHKYFGDENPVGRQITLRYGDGVLRDFAIGAVTENIPDNSSTKEIGIRKVLGASMSQLMNLINYEFYGLLLVASLIASLSGYFVVQALLRSIYAYHVGFSTLPFLMASLTMFVVGVLTVGSQVVKVTRANPVEVLRYE